VHFWLCGGCASTMSLVLEPARGVRLVSVSESDPDTAAHGKAQADVLQAKRC
jgi:hypothetical protein